MLKQILETIVTLTIDVKRLRIKNKKYESK